MPPNTQGAKQWLQTFQRYFMHIKSNFTLPKQYDEGQNEWWVTMLRLCGHSMLSSSKHDHTLAP
jgi:hypothetical protein